jgi:hypothetical protein
MNNPFNKKRITYADTQKEDYVDSPLPDSSAPILARAAAAWNENGDPGVKAFIATLSEPEKQQLTDELLAGSVAVAAKLLLLKLLK